MGLYIENRGTGYVPQVPGSGWRVALSGSPVTVGDSPGKLGSVSFSGRCDATTKFSIDNYVSIKHYANDQTTRWLSTFDGYLRSVSSNGDFATFGVNSILSALDVQRTTSLDIGGTYQRKIVLPSGVEYTIASTTYTTGGYWTTVGGQDVFVKQDILIYDVAARNDYVYVLASGQHAGEVVFVFYADGNLRALWPVYSDATDLASPGSRHISVSSSRIVIGQETAKRVKLFFTGGGFDLQFGASGSADGQFNTVSGVAASSYFNSIFVTDSILGRVQRFNYTGVYQNKWGTAGTGLLPTSFNGLNKITIDPITEDVFVSDMNRARAYDSFGSYRSVTVPNLPVTGVTPVGFDRNGSAYAAQAGKVYKFVTRINDTWGAGSIALDTWQSKYLDSYTYGSAFAVDEVSGAAYIGRDRNVVEQYGVQLGSFQQTISYYIALASPDFPIQNLSTVNPTDTQYPAWDGNIWAGLCDLCAATGNAMAVFDNRLLFFNRTDRVFRLPDDAVFTPLDLNSRGAGQKVLAINLNARRTDGIETMYDSVADDRRVFSIDVNGLAYATVGENNYPEYLLQPVSGLSANAGVYTVVDSDGLLLSNRDWDDYGGKVEVSVGERPGSIAIKISGPGITIPGTNPPYKIASPTGEPTLSITGVGIKTEPETMEIGTGMSESVTGNLVASTLDSPFLIDAATTQTEASWAAYNSGTPSQRLGISFRAHNGFTWVDWTGGVGGTFQFINAIVYHDDSEYIVEDVEYVDGFITLSVYRYNQSGHTSATVADSVARFDEIWNTSNTAQFEAYWAGFTAQDLSIAPLRNPFGINAR